MGKCKHRKGTPQYFEKKILEAVGVIIFRNHLLYVARISFNSSL
jgi:hypothetical protein